MRTVVAGSWSLAGRSDESQRVRLPDPGSPALRSLGIRRPEPQRVRLAFRGPDALGADDDDSRRTCAQ
ncbi:hypothetical protein GCM10009595_18990 [Falsarthrobacter nasiphocae]